MFGFHYLCSMTLLVSTTPLLWQTCDDHSLNLLPTLSPSIGADTNRSRDNMGITTSDAMYEEMRKWRHSCLVAERQRLLIHRPHQLPAIYQVI